MRIAVIRFSSLGDILCTGPAVRGLKRAYPDADIVYITNPGYRDLASALPGVTRVETVERRGSQFAEDRERVVWQGPWDMVVDLQGSPRSGKLTKALKPVRSVTDKPPRLRRTLLIGTRLKLGRFKPVPKRMLDRLAPHGVEDDGGSLRIDVPQATRRRVSEAWGHAPDGAVVLVPGAKHETKRWPDRHWAELVRRLGEGERIVVVGSDGDTPPELADELRNREHVALDLTGRTTPLEAAAVIERASVVVAGDTGPMHLAVATGTPVVALFGPTVREFGFYPFRARAEVLERDLWCRPCTAHGSAHCPLAHHNCLETIVPSEVMDAMARLRAESAAEEERPA